MTDSLIEDAKNNNIISIKEAIESGTDPNYCDENGDTLLILASDKGHYDLAQYLISWGADINAQNTNETMIIGGANRNTALIKACVRGHDDIVDLLIFSGADITQTNQHGSTPLMWAAEKGHQHIVIKLLENIEDKVNYINLTNGRNKTALMYASNKEISEILIEHGCDLNISNKGGYTALIWASRNGNKKIAEMLIKNGANINQQDKNGNTALILAVKKNNKEIVEMLIEHGCESSSTNVDGSEHLNELRCDLDPQDKNGWTALIEASYWGHKEIAEMLIEHGADINIQNWNGNTALIWAVKKNNKEIAEMLIEHGCESSSTNVDGSEHLNKLRCDLNHQNGYGETALIWAVLKNNKEMAEMLIEHGADVRIINDRGKNALIIDKEEMQEFLKTHIGINSIDKYNAFLDVKKEIEFPSLYNIMLSKVYRFEKDHELTYEDQKVSFDIERYNFILDDAIVIPDTVAEDLAEFLI